MGLHNNSVDVQQKRTITYGVIHLLSVTVLQVTRGHTGRVEMFADPTAIVRHEWCILGIGEWYNSKTFNAWAQLRQHPVLFNWQKHSVTW